MGKGDCTITKKLLSFLARSLLYNNLFLEAIFIISMLMVVEGVGEGWVMVFFAHLWETELRNHTTQDYN